VERKNRDDVFCAGEETTISSSVNYNRDLNWRIRIKKGRRTIREFPGNKLPISCKWDGKNKRGKSVKPGKYKYEISVWIEDEAGEKIVSAKKVSGEVTLIRVKLAFQNSKMSFPKVIDPLDPPKNVRIGVVKGDSITFKAILTPEVALEDEEYSWAGEKTGIGPEILVRFNRTGNRTEVLTVLGVTRKATITVVRVPPPNQRIWSRAHRLAAIRAWLLSRESIRWARSICTHPRVHNCRADAARHAYWNVLMTLEIGVRDAEGAATSHERTNLEEGGAHNEIVMDLENNADGRRIGRQLPPSAFTQDTENKNKNMLR